MENIQNGTKQKNHFCFLALSMRLEKRDKEEKEKIAKEIYDLVKEKYPEVDLEFYDYRNNMYKVCLGDFFLKLPCVKTGELNIDCLISAIDFFQNKVEYQKNGKLEYKYYAYIYKLITDKWLGERKGKLCQSDFLKMMKEQYNFVVGESTNFSYHVPTGTFPDWKFNNMNNIKKLTEAIEFAKVFLMKYWELKDHITDLK